jgi:hypothetical protein
MNKIKGNERYFQDTIVYIVKELSEGYTQIELNEKKGKIKTEYLTEIDSEEVVEKEIIITNRR